MTRSGINRRRFAGLAGGAAVSASLGYGRVLGANDRVRLGFLGVGNRGCQLLKGFLAQPDAEIVTLCDVYQPYLQADSTRIDSRFRNLAGRLPRMPEIPNTGSVERVKDFRRVLERKDIDAIVIATPDHWHALQTVAACRSGKDVYCEKPLSVTIREGRAMVAAARTHDRIVQVGTHRRSSRMYAELAEKIQSGALGKITVARIAYSSNMTPGGIGKAPDSQPPADLDWDLWLGPRPLRPFNENVMPYKFRWWNLYSSQMANWGVHYFDLVRWLTGERAPASVVAVGGRYAVDDDRTVPDTCETVFEHSSGMLTVFSLYESTGQPVLGRGAELELRGTVGTLYASQNNWEIVPERGGQFQDPAPRCAGAKGVAPESDRDLDAQAARDFLDNLKARRRPKADVEEGHRSTSFALLANIALATRERLTWDADTERFTNHEAANALLHYDYRPPWTLEG
jgi:predicted dehydrogenase